MILRQFQQVRVAMTFSVVNEKTRAIKPFGSMSTTELRDTLDKSYKVGNYALKSLIRLFPEDDQNILTFYEDRKSIIRKKGDQNVQTFTHR